MKLFRNVTGALALLAAAFAFVALPATAQILPGQAGPNFKNLVDNGWFNVDQRGSGNVTSISTVVKYGPADRWFSFSGTSTTLTASYLTTGLPTGTGTPVFQAGMQLQRNSSVSAVVLSCLNEEIPTNDITGLAGQPVTLSFWALAGANFSAANSVLQAKLQTGTSADEGSAQLITGFTGQAFPINGSQAITTAWQRYAWTGIIPATAIEAAVQFCWTPVGTAGTSDYFDITGVQLEQGTVATNLEARPYGVELAKDQRYYWQATESATIIQERGVCSMSTTSIANCLINFPVQMRVAPTMTYATGFEASASTASSSATACTAVTTSATLTGNAASPNGVIIDCASSAGFGAAGTSGFLWDVGTGTPGGKIQASADF